jgi:diguanylate cyclase (GGDEF)-like protein/PAS domain S-box-containing protein
MIFVLSKSKSRAEEIINVIGNINPLEDSVYHLNAAEYGDTCDIGVDSAVIIDGGVENPHDYKRVRNERIVYLTSANNMGEIDSDTLSSIDDLWITSGNQASDEALLNVYFSKLLKTMKDNSDRRKMEICFRTVIDSLPDLVWFKDNDGAHLIVNYEFCGVVEKSKKQIYKKHHNYIWDVPEDDYENGEAVCRQSEEVVIKKRKTCQFEEKITTRDGMRQLVTYKSPLIDEDGTIFGTCGMGHDITDLQNVTKELRIIIDSIPFGLAIVDDSGDVLAVNKFLLEFFPDASDCVGHSFEEWNNRLSKEKICTIQGEDEYRVLHGEQEYIMRFSVEPIVDIFGENIGYIQFIHDITLQYNYEQQNIKYANTDFLTGLNNRRSLFDYLSGIERNSKIAIIMLDLDKFKGVNDTYGHAAGDEALKITAKVLEECFPDGFISRIGGDEFIIALVGEYDLSQVEERTQNLLDSLKEKYLLRNEFKEMSSSAGIAQERLSVCNIRSIEELVKRSDDALYTAKESGKARYCVNK